MSVNLKTRAIEIVVKINERLKNMKLIDQMFKEDDKVLKVRSMK